MKINVKNLKLEVNNLKKIIEEYDDIYLNLYNEFSLSSFLWNDTNSKKFYKDLDVEKIRVQDTINEMYSINNIYKYIINQYEKIGNNIYYDLSNKNIILSDIKKYQQRLNVIINKYNNLDTSSCPQISNYIIKEKTIIKESLNLTNTVYKNINILYKKLEELDKEIKLRVSKIDISYIKENDIYDYV